MVESVTSQLTLMEADNHDPITIYVNSPGGSADCGFAIYDLFRFVESPIITLCSGICASAAILIFLGGEKGRRYSLEHSRFYYTNPQQLLKVQHLTFKSQRRRSSSCVNATTRLWSRD